MISRFLFCLHVTVCLMYTAALASFFDEPNGWFISIELFLIFVNAAMALNCFEDILSDHL